MRRQGLFVTIDGPSGVGKTTTARLLAERLRERGFPTHNTTEPSDSAIGALARKHVEEATGPTLACLFAADRYHHLAQQTRPRLATGESVVQDRYLASSLVMQRLDGLELDYLSALNRYADPPDLSVILTADPTLIAKRLARRGTHNRYQDEPGSSHRESRFFTDAADHLEELGLPVRRVDTNDTHPTALAARLVEQIITLADSTPAEASVSEAEQAGT